MVFRILSLILRFISAPSMVWVRFFIILMCFASSSAFAVDKELHKRVKDLAKQDGKEHSNLVEKALKDADGQDLSSVQAILDSPEYQERLARNQDRALVSMGLKEFADSLPTKQADDEGNFLGDRVVLFVSSSMPRHILRNYVTDIMKVDGVMVFRGTIGGIDSLDPTMAFMRDILRKNEHCTLANCPMFQANVSIDPDRFRHHGINRVPALIFEKDMKIQAYCQAEELSDPASVVVYGDASLLGMTQALLQQHDDPGLRQAVSTLRGMPK